jgi:kynureninase
LALPKAAAGASRAVLRDEWGEMLITGWNRAGWMEMPSPHGRPRRTPDRRPGSVVMGDTLSVKVYQALEEFCRGNDLYIAEALHRRPSRPRMWP